MSKKKARLAPLSVTLRELFLKSGNLCAYPGCGKLMMNADGVFIGMVCHIEGAEEGGERFNCFWQLGLAHFGGLIWPTPWDVKV
jgi:hypothetical protein